MPYGRKYSKQFSVKVPKQKTDGSIQLDQDNTAIFKRNTERYHAI